MQGLDKNKPDCSLPACAPAEIIAAGGDEPSPGDRFEGYVIKECIGEGEIGRAHD